MNMAVGAMKMRIVSTVVTSFFLWIGSTAAFATQTGDVNQITTWLDLPTTWSRTVKDNVLVVVPNDLPAGRTLLMMIEPLSKSSASLQADYDQALRDLAPWRPVGQPVEQRFDTGWVFRMGVGVVSLNGIIYTAETTVARHRKMRVRFWVLADSDATFNQYKNTFSTAMSSAQDITRHTASVATPSSAPVQSTNFKLYRPDPAFGKGISGVYIGLERGLSFSSGAGVGQQQVFNPSTGRYETSNTGVAPQLNTSISDYEEIDVFYPDGTYRRRLPTRGLAADPNWERRHQPDLWGTWHKQGNQIVTQRGSYMTRYTIKSDQILISDRDRPWHKLPPQPGVRLEGVFVRGDFRDADAPRLVLHTDGSYQDRNGFLHMMTTVWNLVVPDGENMISHWDKVEQQRFLGPGSGSYTLGDFTLTLYDRDGRIWQVTAYLPPGETAPHPRYLVINGKRLVRE